MRDEQRAVEVVVAGRVQGVFFRASTVDVAAAHDVAGWVRNDPAGTVTAHLEGESDAVEAVLTWVRDGGPPFANVSSVEVREVPMAGATTFAVVR